jgi:hypothetical protein
VRPARQTPGKQFRQRGLGQIGLAPVLISSRHVAHLRGEDARQTVIVGYGELLELRPRPACWERTDLGMPKFSAFADAQSVGARGIDARLRQCIAYEGTNLDPGP